VRQSGAWSLSGSLHSQHEQDQETRRILSQQRADNDLAAVGHAGKPPNIGQVSDLKRELFQDRYRRR
jgi:hypothetical protein